MQNNYTLLWRTLKHNAAQQQKTTSSYAHSSEAKTGEKTAPPRRRSMRKDLRAFFSFFVRSFATQTSFCTGCNETKKKQNMQNASYNMKWNIIILRLRLRCLHIGYIIIMNSFSSAIRFNRLNARILFFSLRFVRP